MGQLQFDQLEIKLQLHCFSAITVTVYNNYTFKNQDLLQLQLQPVFENTCFLIFRKNMTFFIF